MLSDEDKRRIREEEIFRAQVQAELSKARRPTTKGAKIFEFLQSSLGIWLLSSVVLALFTAVFTKWADARAEQARKVQLILKLDEEIQARIEDATFRGGVGYKNFDSSKCAIHREFEGRQTASLLREMVAVSRLPADEFHNQIVKWMFDAQSAGTLIPAAWPESVPEKLRVDENLDKYKYALEMISGHWQIYHDHISKRYR